MPPDTTRSDSPPGYWRGLHKWGVRNPKYYYIAPPSVWAVLIYVLSLAPISTPEPVAAWELPNLDKLIHAAFYGMLALLILRGWQREKMPPLGLHGFVFALCMVFGIMIEIHQGLIPYRSFEGFDIVADAVGAAGGLVVWHLAMVRWGKRTRLYPGLMRPEFKNSPANKGRKSEERALRRHEEHEDR